MFDTFKRHLAGASGVATFGLGAIIALLVGCGDPATDGEVEPLPADEVTYQASSATRTELGVTTWSVSKAGDGTVKGRDAANAVVVELAHAQKGDLHRYVLRQGSDTATMTMAMESHEDGDVGVRMLENSFVGLSGSKRTLELMNADLAAHEPAAGIRRRAASTHLAQNALRPTTLRPLDSSGDCSQSGDDTLVCDRDMELVTSCQELIDQARALRVQIPDACWSCMECPRQQTGAPNPTACALCDSNCTAIANAYRGVDAAAGACNRDRSQD